MPNLLSHLFVAIVVFEETVRFAVANLYADFSLFTILTLCAISFKQVDVVLRIRFTHATRLWSVPREGAESHCGLSLSEALHEAYACKLVKLIIHGSVQRLARRAAVAQRREVVL